MVSADQGHARRAVLQAGAAVAIGAVATRGGSLARATTISAIDAEALQPGEFRMFAGGYVPKD
jgi:hypothetical protein